jgi:hypothetical protein
MTTHTVRYTEPLVRKAIQRTIVRLLGPLYFIAMGLLAVSMILAAVQESHGWFVGVVATALTLGTLVPVVAIRTHTKAAISRLVQLDDGAASIDIGEERLRLSSKLGSIDLPLARVTTVWEYEDCWVLLAGRSILMTLPIEGVPQSTLDAWRAGLEASGAKFE